MIILTDTCKEMQGHKEIPQKYQKRKYFSRQNSRNVPKLNFSEILLAHSTAQTAKKQACTNYLKEIALRLLKKRICTKCLFVLLENLH